MFFKQVPGSITKDSKSCARATAMQLKSYFYISDNNEQDLFKHCIVELCKLNETKRRKMHTGRLRGTAQGGIDG